MKIYAFDFDGTIYDGDSSIDFYKFCFKKKKSICKYWLKQIWYFFLYILRVKSKTEMKEVFFCFLKEFSNKKQLLNEFWNINFKKIKKWYLDRDHKNDVIISASPEFLLKYPCKQLKVKDLIASEVDIDTGKFLKENCCGIEKVNRIKEKYNNISVEEMYTDSLSDLPMIKCSKCGYIVKKNKIMTYSMKKTNSNKLEYIKIIFNILLIISFICITSILTIGGHQYNKLIFYFNILFSGIISGFALFKHNLVMKIINKKIVLGKKFDYVLAFILGILSSRVLIKFFYNNPSLIKDVLTGVCFKFSLQFKFLWIFECFCLFAFSILGLSFLYLCLIRYVFPKIISFFKNSNIIEKKFLIYTTSILCVIALAIQLQTSAFTAPVPKGFNNINIYDALYTTDSGEHVATRGFENLNAPENDMRQPLFGLFSFPFGLIANVASEFLDLIPSNFTYSYVIVCLQIFALAICSILLARMIEKESNIFCLLLFMSMYATIFFAFNIEQYVFGLFWLILLFYNYVKNKKSNVFLAVSAIGSLVTNAIFVPFLIKKDSIKNFIKEGFDHIFLFVCIIIVSGKTWSIVDGIQRFEKFESFMGVNITFKNKVLQYLSFISNCFVAPHGIVKTSKFGFPSYQLDVVSSVSIVGVLLLFLMIVSFIINRKKTIAKIAFGWLIFSFIILVIIGWGTVENGLIIYGVYFSWAYFILIYLLLDKVLEKLPKKLKMVILIMIILLLLIFNITELVNIVKFGRTYYPFRD